MVTKSPEDDGTTKVDTGAKPPAPLEKVEEFINGVVIIVRMVATTLLLGVFIAARRDSLTLSSDLRRKGWLLSEQGCVIVTAALGAAIGVVEGGFPAPLKLSAWLDKAHNPDNWFVAFAITFLVFQGALQIGKLLVRKICPSDSADPGLLLALVLMGMSTYETVRNYLFIDVVAKGPQVYTPWIWKESVVSWGLYLLVGRAGWQYARQLLPQPTGSKVSERLPQKLLRALEEAGDRLPQKGGCAFAFAVVTSVLLTGMTAGAYVLTEQFQKFQDERTAHNLLTIQGGACTRTDGGFDCLFMVSTTQSKILLNHLPTVSVSTYDFTKSTYTNYDLLEGAEILPIQPPPSGAFWSLENNQQGLMLIRLSASRSCPQLKSVLEKDFAASFYPMSIRTLWSGFAVTSYDKVVPFDSFELVTKFGSWNGLWDMCHVKASH